MATVTQVAISRYIDAIEDLVKANWAETGFDFPLDLDKDYYRDLAEQGLIFAVGALDNDMALCGYCTFTVTPHPYNRAVVLANTDALFLREDYRNGTVYGRMKSAVKDLAREKGCHAILWHARGNTPFAELLDKRHELADSVYMERL